jgi:hypothetical protein
MLYPEKERDSEDLAPSGAFRKSPQKAILGLEHKWVWQDPGLDIIYMSLAGSLTQQGQSSLRHA